MFIWILIGAENGWDYPPWPVRTYRSQERAEVDCAKLNTLAKAHVVPESERTTHLYQEYKKPSQEWTALDPEMISSRGDVYYEIQRIEYDLE